MHTRNVVTVHALWCFISEYADGFRCNNILDVYIKRWEHTCFVSSLNNIINNLHENRITYLTD